MTAPHPQVRRLSRVSLTSADLDGLQHFYMEAFGFQLITQHYHSGATFESSMGVEGGARSAMLGLGQERLELLQFDAAGGPYPPEADAADLVFQHFALVTANMAEAYRRLQAVKGWTAISREGPQRLPDSSGGVTAFKFRDPEGHPLELLAFPEGRAPARWSARSDKDTCAGIDHSAVSVRDTFRSVAFYTSLGLQVSAQTVNHGTQQDALDARPDAELEVTALEPRAGGPHVELLCYRSKLQGPAPSLHNNDIAATRLVLECDGMRPADAQSIAGRCIFDPDGHHLLLVHGDRLGDSR